ncbi:PPM-type phosphatase domain [Sesbania bispinosa]|nr:PPM-type phosphatase domain [Sesbania bispinosa]
MSLKLINSSRFLATKFWDDPAASIAKAYLSTDQAILSHSSNLGHGGSTTVTAILINGQKLLIANVGDSRAVLSRKGQAVQVTIDHEPNTERGSIENKGGFVSNIPDSAQDGNQALFWFWTSLLPPLSWVFLTNSHQCLQTHEACLKPWEKEVHYPCHWPSYKGRVGGGCWGGAVGVYGAIHAKIVAPHLGVVVIEKGKPLSKVKVSGGGRCNVINGHCADNVVVLLSF